MLHRVLRGVPGGRQGGAGEDKGTDLFDTRTLDLEWWTQWDMASEDYNNILQFTEDCTGCVVDGERIARGRSYTPDSPQHRRVECPSGTPRPRTSNACGPGGKTLSRSSACPSRPCCASALLE